MSREYTATVSFHILYTVDEEGVDDIHDRAAKDNSSSLEAARNQLADLLSGLDFPSVPLFGIPGSSIEAVSIVQQAGNVRNIHQQP